MAIIMRMWGSASSGPTPYDGQYLKDFDFEAHGGIGEITMTSEPVDAKQFDNIAEAMTFWQQSPKCKPIREDGRPNRPMTAGNWEFVTL